MTNAGPNAQHYIQCFKGPFVWYRSFIFGLITCFVIWWFFIGWSWVLEGTGILLTEREWLEWDEDQITRLNGLTDSNTKASSMKILFSIFGFALTVWLIYRFPRIAVYPVSMAVLYMLPKVWNSHFGTEFAHEIFTPHNVEAFLYADALFVIYPIHAAALLSSYFLIRQIQTDWCLIFSKSSERQ